MVKWLVLVVSAMAGIMLAIGVVVLVSSARSSGQDQQVSRLTQWEQCELNSNGWGQAGDPCGPMPQP